MLALLSVVTLALATLASCSSYQRLHRSGGPLKRPQDRLTRGDTNKYILEVQEGLSVGYVAKQIKTKPSENVSYYKAFDCTDVFSGLAIETSTENADTLRQMEGVVNVWPLKSVPKAPVPKKTRVSAESLRANYSLHHWTGVNKLHAAGIRGKGATVAVIDTGIDYTHKALGGCFGPGCKVAGGYDLVGTQWNTHQEDRYPKTPDDDPKDFYGHGTHVAGIIAAENEWLVGVAPDAELLSYKVFADNPLDTDEEVLIQAFCDAYSSGADVITASIGRPNGFVDNPWALIAKRIVDKGVVVTISAGNEGYSGPIYSSSGSNGDGVLSVASINVTTRLNQTEKPVAAYFTTWGPTNELLLKPDIGAPGYDIVSTVPGQGYEEMSGTSMAAPYIAGVAALWIGKNGGRAVNGPGVARALASRIASSGRSVAWSADRLRYNKTAPPFQVGTGLVDAWKVLQYDTQLTGPPFALLDSETFKSNWTMGITNGGNTSITYTFELEPQAGVELLDPYYGVKTLYELEPVNIAPNVTLPKPVTVKPGQTKVVEFRFEAPDVDDDYLPLYGGKVWFKGDNGEKLAVPYGGAAYDTEKEFDTMFATPPYVNEYENDWKWTFNTQTAPYDFVELSARLRYPCFHLRWDIYLPYWDDRTWELPTKAEGSYVGSATTFRDADMYWYFDPQRMDKEDTIPFPIMHVPRGFASYWWFGKLANGSYLEPGNYTMRFAALRPYGNPNISDHWDVMGDGAVEFEVLAPVMSNSTANSTAPRLMRRPYQV